MPHIALSRIIEGVDHQLIYNRRDTPVSGVCYDSRRVQPGDLFVAVPGEHTDGHRFVEQAAARGAAAIIHSSPLALYPEGVVCIEVQNSRVAMAQAATLFYGAPADSLTLIGVTGTDGKSTTAYFIYQLLNQLDRRCGFLSTVAIDRGAGLEKNRLRQSTPESPEIQRSLASMRDAGYRFAVIEATSHGLSRRTARLLGLRFEAALFTNISHEHLEFHGSFERYRDDKTNLFGALSDSRDSFGVVNADDANHNWFERATARPVYRYAIDRSDVDLQAIACRYSSEHSDCEFADHVAGTATAVRIAAPARFNIENALAAVLCVSRLLQLPVAELASAIGSLQPVPGRMAPVAGTQPFSVIVDYAHSPGSFEKVFPIFRSHTKGRLIAVFGSAGERDIQKRPLQGAIAARYCDTLVLADEDPRGEDPLTILRQIADGALKQNPALREGQSLLLIPDRREAIHSALELAGPEDTVVMLGKGHEGNIIYHDGAIDWDERRVAEEALRSLGYTVGAKETSPC